MVTINITTIYIILSIVSFFLIKNILNPIFKLDEEKINNKRMNQLVFEKKLSKEDENKKLIDAATRRVSRFLAPNMSKTQVSQLQKDLKMAGWDKYFTPIQFHSLVFLSRVVGGIAFLLLFKVAIPVAVIWLLVPAVAPSFFLSNSKSERKTRIMRGFPDVIRMMEGFLTAGTNISKAAKETIRYSNDEWKPILQEFVINIDTLGVDGAIDKMKSDIDIFEVREFLGLISLSIERGANLKDSFTAQADRIRDMQKSLILIKIEKRQIFAMMIQGPLLLCNIIIFGLPTVSSMMNLSSV